MEEQENIMGTCWSGVSALRFLLSVAREGYMNGNVEVL